MRTIEELTADVQHLFKFRGDNEVHHAECDEAAYDLLTLLCVGEEPDKIREAAEHIVDELNWKDEGDYYEKRWWYA